MSLQVTMMICFYDLTHQERCQVPWLMALAPKTWYAKGAGVENYPGCHEFQTQCFCFSGLPSLCLWMCWQVLDGDQTVVLHRRRTHQWTACQPAAYKDQWSRENISQMFYLLLMLRKKNMPPLKGEQVDEGKKKKKTQKFQQTCGQRDRAGTCVWIKCEFSSITHFYKWSISSKIKAVL